MLWQERLQTLHIIIFFFIKYNSFIYIAQIIKIKSLQVTNYFRTMVIFTKSKENGLLSTMQTLYDSNQFTDIELKVGEETFKVHKPVIYHSSPMLRGLLTSETADKYKDLIELKRVDGEYFKPVVKYMYSEQIEINSENILGILSVVDY